MDTVLDDLQPFEREVLACLNSAPPRTKYCAKSAIVHLEKAGKLIGLDAEMAIFRSFCAEEEAATSLFAAIKFRGYKNASRLNFRNHTQKQAAYAFLRAIGDVFAAARPPLPPVRLASRKDGKNREILVQIQVAPSEWAELQPPLSFSIVAAETGKEARFASEFENLARTAGQVDVAEFLRVNANRRNEILYASDDGAPVVTGGAEDTLSKARGRVFALLTVSCLVFPFAKRAPFVQQALDAFLLAVGSVKESDLNW